MSRDTGADRRAAPRLAADGEVRLFPGGATGKAVVGQLVDVSATGFRCRHDCLALASGDAVPFEFAGVEGVARVVWMRILGGSAETGLVIVTPAL
jgi:hypothetical protein